MDLSENDPLAEDDAATSEGEKNVGRDEILDRTGFPEERAIS